MAIFITTDDPRKLVRRIFLWTTSGRLPTWECNDEDTHEYTHKSHAKDANFYKKAWMKPRIDGTRVIVNIRVTDEDFDGMYAHYHGRFMSALLSHFRDLFQIASASAEPSREDTHEAANEEEDE